MRSHFDLLPRWTCAATRADGWGTCSDDAKWRARFTSKSAHWTTYCDRHRPENAERIPADVEWHEVTCIVEVAIAAMDSGQPGAAIDAALRCVNNTLETLGARVRVVKTGATFHQGTASAGLRLQFDAYGGGGGTPFPEKVSNRPLRASLRRVEKKRGTG